MLTFTASSILIFTSDAVSLISTVVRAESTAPRPGIVTVVAALVFPVAGVTAWAPVSDIHILIAIPPFSGMAVTMLRLVTTVRVSATAVGHLPFSTTATPITITVIMWAANTGITAIIMNSPVPVPVLREGWPCSLPVPLAVAVAVAHGVVPAPSQTSGGGDGRSGILDEVGAAASTTVS